MLARVIIPRGTPARPGAVSGAALEIATVFGAATLLMASGLAGFVAVAGAPTAWVLLRRQPGGLQAVGLSRSRCSIRAAAVGGALGLALVVFAVLAWPFDEWITGADLDISQLQSAVATPAGFASMLIVSWAVAGFGEEWFFRAYPMTRGRDLPTGWQATIAAGAVAVFGFGHLYQGPAGMLLSGSLGAGLMAIYLGSGRNLWVAVIAHGTVDPRRSF